jgi:hypothetical protein
MIFRVRFYLKSGATFTLDAGDQEHAVSALEVVSAALQPHSEVCNISTKQGVVRVADISAAIIEEIKGA